MYQEASYKDSDTIYIRLVTIKKGIFIVYVMGKEDYERTKFVDQYYVALIDYSNLNNTANSYSVLYKDININILSRLDIRDKDSNIVLPVYCNITSKGSIEIFAKDENGNSKFVYTTSYDTESGHITNEHESSFGNIEVHKFDYLDR